MPRWLTDDQREQRQTLAHDLFERSCEDVQFLKNIETRDESWFYRYTAERSHVSVTKEGAPGGKQNKGYVTGVFLILRVSYTTSTLPTGKQLTTSSTWRSCDVCVNQFTENGWKNGGMATGSCTTTMLQHTLHILCSSFWPNTAPLSCSNRHTH